MSTSEEPENKNLKKTEELGVDVRPKEGKQLKTKLSRDCITIKRRTKKYQYQLQSLLADHADADRLVEAREEYDSLSNELYTAYSDLEAIIEDEKESEKHKQAYEEFEIEETNLLFEVNRRIHDLRSDDISVSNGSSRSYFSSGNGIFTQREAEPIDQTSKLERINKYIQTQDEIKLVEVRESPIIRNTDDTPNIAYDNPTNGMAGSPTSDTTTNDVMLKMVELMSSRQDRDGLPKIEPETFKGEVLKYPVWIKSFETFIESRTLNPSERLFYLSKYLSGEAKQSVAGLLTLDTSEAYNKAKTILTNRYGTPFILAEEYRREIENWKPIAPNDGEGLRKCTDFLQSCETAMVKIQYLQILNDAKENQKMLKILPNYICNSWSKLADSWIQGEVHGKPATYPPFSEFVKFLTKESRIACDPVTSFKARKGANTATKSDKKRHTSLSTSVTQKKEENCKYCQGDHCLDDCKRYLSLSLTERRNFIRKKGLCNGCFKYGHIRQNCQDKKTCNRCHRLHPMNEDFINKIQRKKTEIFSNCVDIGYSSHSLIIPAWLYLEDKPENKKLCYVIVDDQSDVTFIETSTIRQLNADGPEIELTLNTMLSSATIPSKKISGLVLRGYNEETEIPLSPVYTRDVIPASRQQIPRQETAEKWLHLKPIAKKLMPYSEDIDIAVLVGRNCLRAMKPREIIPGKNDEPYAVKTELGWGIISTTMDEDNHQSHTNHVVTKMVQMEPNIGETQRCHFVLKTQVKEVISPQQVRRMFEQDFNEVKSQDTSYSQNEKKFLKTLENGIHRTTDGHYEMPLPFKEENVTLPNNKYMVMNRTKTLQKRLLYDVQYRKDYEHFMKSTLENGYAELVPKDELSLDNGHIWYIPHHGIYNAKKPGKIRIVYDCSAEYKGISINQKLHTGLDLTSSLLGVLCRFRQDEVAFMCDIEGMFNQVRVNEAHRNFLRFLWWSDGDYKKPPEDYRMTTHLFGATSSPACANFALKKTANDFQDLYGTEPSNFLQRDFYVDDGLKSVPSASDAIKLIKNTVALCQKGGFHLHKFVSNNQTVLSSIPPKERAADKNANLFKETSTIERALGVYWCVESDEFQFRIELKDKPLTRRGILSTVSSIFDPLGMVSPFLLQGKTILQELCRENTSWDDEISSEIRTKWEKWRNNIHLLENVKIHRCYKPTNFGQVKTVELHHFSDASQSGYGQCSYLRLVNQQNQVHCCLVLAKSRVTPLKPISIPRLELSAAVVSLKVSQLLSKELEYKNIEQVYWTDSKVVLGYITNDTRRFHIFVANRIQQIRDSSTPDQWHYIETSQNPADDASRGLNADELVKNQRWWNGPSFLWEMEIPYKETQTEFILNSEDPEVKKISTLITNVTEFPSILKRLERFSSWFKMKKSIAVCINYMTRLRKGSRSRNIQVSVADIKEAENLIIKQVQKENFSEELKLLSNQVTKHDKDQEMISTVKKTSTLHKLDPFLDETGILRVGGRIKNGDFPIEVRNPAILPRRHHITSAIIAYFHNKVHHQGRGITQNEIRASGFWIINGSSEIGYHISKCIQCKKTRSPVHEQKMANLPEDRITPAPPFTFCAVDCFGPFYVKEGRKEMKRYGVIYTCMSSRAVHLETLNTMTADSFINSYRRFVCRRGPVQQIRSDRGSNFIGANNEFATSFNDQVRLTLQEDSCDWIPFKMNFPESSHMGGSWERQMRSVRNVLNHLLTHGGLQLDDETLRTFMLEAEAIVNCRPLTTNSINDPNSLSPLTPNHLLTSKTRVVMPPPGIFQKADMYAKKRWRRVQHLSNEFWMRWRKEFLQTLQVRQKWCRPRRNLEKNDIVIVKNEDLPRNKWNLARVEESFKGDDGLVRKVRLVIGDRHLDKSGKRRNAVKILERPIHKLVLLLAKED